jgi:integrase
MACVRKRRGKYVVDWRDGAGVRHWKTFNRKVDADAFRDQVGPQARHRLTPMVRPTSTIKEYADHWTGLIGQAVKPRTLARYREILDLHILPRFEKVRVQDMERSRIKLFLAEKLNAGLQKRTVRNIHAVLRNMLNATIEDGVLASNPAGKLGRALKLTVSRATTQEEVKAMTKVQRQFFLATALREAPRYYPFFFVLAGTGMRLGEALGLQQGDADYSTRTIRIARAFSEDGTLDTPKSGHGRTVDMSQALADALDAHERTRLRDKLKHGWAELPPWLFMTKAGTPLDPANVRRAMQRILKAARLPEHFTPHCLRHTYASLLLADAISPVYVQEQLGHATIELTVSTYGRWLKKKAPGALDRLELPTILEGGSKLVASGLSDKKTAPVPFGQEPYIQALTMEPASGIEPPTCGLRTTSIISVFLGNRMNIGVWAVTP